MVLIELLLALRTKSQELQTVRAGVRLWLRYARVPVHASIRTLPARVRTVFFGCKAVAAREVRVGYGDTAARRVSGAQGDAPAIGTREVNECSREFVGHVCRVQDVSDWIDEVISVRCDGDDRGFISNLRRSIARCW